MADDKDLKNLTYSIQFDSDDDPLKKITDKEKDIDDGFKKIGETVDEADKGIKGITETLEDTAKGGEKANESSKGLLDTLMNIFGIEEKTTNESKTLTETISSLSKKGEDGINGMVESLSKIGDVGSKVGDTLTNIVNKANNGIDNAGNKITDSINSIAEKMGIIKEASEEDVEALKKADTYFELMGEKASTQSRIVKDLSDQYDHLVERLGYGNEETEQFKMKLINAQLEEQKLNEQVDKAGEALQKAQEKVEGVANGFNKADEASNKLNETTKKVSSGVGSMLAAFGFMGVAFTLADGIKSATKAYADFEQEMARTHSVIGDVSQKDLTALSNKAIDLSNKYGIASKDIAGAEESLASNGLDAKQVLGTLQSTVTLATAGNIKMEDSANDVATALKNFGLGADQANHVVDVYARTAAETASELPDIATAMKYIGPIATQVGWNIEGVSAAIGELSDAGLKGQKAGTTLREIVSRLINPTGEAKKSIQELGFSAVDPATHKFKSLTDILKDLNKAMESHGITNAAEKNATLEKIFGQQGFTGVSALMKAPDAIQKLTDKLQNADGAGKKMANTMNDTLGGAFNRFKQGVTNAFIKNINKTELGKTLKDFLNSMTKNLPQISKAINTVLQDAMKFASYIKTNWSTLAPIVATVASAYAGLKAVGTIGAIVSNIKELGKAATPMSGFALALSLAAGAFVAFKKGSTGMGIVLSGLALGIGYVSFAMGVLGAVSWPVVAVIGAITLIVLGVYEAYKHWAEIHQVLIDKLHSLELTAAKVWDGITKSLQNYVNTWVGCFNAVLAPINAIIKGINFISGAKIPELTVPKANFATNTAAGVEKSIAKSQGPAPKITGNKFMLMPQFAEGTSSAPGGLSIVGERGPELVELPRGAKVTPNSGLKDALNQKSGLDISSVTKEYDKNIRSMIPKFTKYGQMLNSNLGGGLTKNASQVADPINDLTDNTHTVLTKFSKDSIQYGQGIDNSIGQGIQSNSEATLSKENNLIQSMKNNFQTFVQSCLQYGQGIDSELRLGIQDSEQSVVDIVNDLANKVINQFKVTFGIHSPARVTRKLGNFVGQGFALGLSDMDINTFIKKWIGDTSSLAKGDLGSALGSILSPMFAKGDSKGIIGMVYGLLHGGDGLSGLGSSLGGNVSQWLTMALALTKTPMDWLSGLLKLVSAESGGSATEINTTAVGGEYATGLLQTLPSTFKEFMQPGLGDILNPIDNAAAAINYIKSRYGTVYNTPLFKGGTYSGYAEGTKNASAGPHWVGELGPELLWFKGGEGVTPNNKLAQLKSYTNKSSSQNAQITLSPTFQITIQGNGDNADLTKKVERMMKDKFSKWLEDEGKALNRALFGSAQS